MPAFRFGRYLLKKFWLGWDILFLLFLAFTNFAFWHISLPEPRLTLIRSFGLLLLITFFAFSRLPPLLVAAVKTLIANERNWDRRLKLVGLAITPLAIGAFFLLSVILPRNLHWALGEKEEATPSASLEDFFLEASTSAMVKSKISEGEPALIKRNWRAEEAVEVFVGSHRMGDLDTVITSPRGKEISLPVRIEGETLKISPKGNFRPGKYHLKITSSEGTVLEEDFTWGVLAINTNKSIFLPGEKVYLQMAVLSDYGHTVCHANLKLEILDPQSEKTTFKTKNGGIESSDICGSDNVTDSPDYFSYYQVSKQGTYQLKLTNLDNKYEIVDSFEVKESLPFEVERVGATRINPYKANYTMTIKVKANQDFAGEVIETVPDSFEIKSQVPSTKFQINSKSQIPNSKQIAWEVDWKKGENYELSYEYDAPEISPQFYLLGPLTVQPFNHSAIVFEESRHWQIAADAACANNATGNWNDGTKWTGCTGGGAPAAGDTVTIIANTTMTLNTDATVAGLTVCATTCAKAAILTHSGTYKLTVNGTVTMNQPTANAKTNDWQINGGSADVSGLITFAGSNTTTTRVAQITITTGTLNANAGMTFTASAAATKVLYMSGSTGRLNLKGALTIGAASSTFTMGTSGSIFNYADSAAAQTVAFPSAGAYNYLYLNNIHANGVTLGASITSTLVTGDLVVGDGSNSALFKNGGLEIGLADSKTFEVKNGAYFEASGTSTFPTGTGITYTFGATSTVSYLQTNGTVITNATYGHLKLMPAGATALVLPATLSDIAGNLTIGNGTNAGATADTNDPSFAVAGILTVAANATYTTGSGTLTLSNTGTPLVIAGTFTVTSGNTVDYTGNGATTTCTGASYFAIGLKPSSSTAQTICAGSSQTLTMTNNLTVGDGTNQGASGATYSPIINVTGTLTVAAGATFTMGNAAMAITSTSSISGTLTTATGGTGTRTFTGAVTVQSGGVWDLSGQNPATSFAGGITQSGTTFNNGTGAAAFTENQSLLGANAMTFGGTITPASTKTLTNSNTGTVTVSSTGSIVLTGNFTQGVSSILELAATSPFSGAGTFDAATNANTVNYSGTGQTIKDVTYRNLTVSGTISTGTQTATVGGVFNVSGGTFTPSAGTMTFNTGSSISNTGTLTFVNVSIASSAAVSTADSFSVSGNWSSAGSFTASAGTITFNGGDESTQAFTGNSSFKNFTATTFSNSLGRILQFAGSSETTVTGTWTVTGYSLKVITLQSSNTDNWTITPTSSAVTYVDVYRSTWSGTPTCATFSTKDGNTLNWTVAGGASCNTAPEAPSVLVQKKTGGTVLATGDWSNETDIKFTANAEDADAPDTLYLCVEKKAIETAFTGPEDACSSPGVSYNGTPVEVTVTIAGVTDTRYHWRARVRDAGGLYSDWVAYGSNPVGDGSGDGSPANLDYGIDTSDPTLGDVYDGTDVGMDTDFSTTSLSELSANWANFVATVSGLDHYDYSIGTSQGGTNVANWTDVGVGSSATATGLILQTSQIYYYNVRAVDEAGNTQDPAISSDGQVVAPSLSFGVAPATLPFDNLNSVNSYTASEDVTLTTSTNAYNGYVVRAFITDYPRSTDGNDYTIIDFNGGFYASPDGWLASDRGFGYTSSDTSIGIGGSNIFNSNPCPGGNGTSCYAPFSHDPPGDIIADHIANVSGLPITGEEFIITCKVAADISKEAATYTTTIVYSITAQY